MVHACNPPDDIFLVAGFFKLFFNKRFLFDHHDINPELYEAKFGRRDMFYRLMLLWERLTFRIADISVATIDPPQPSASAVRLDCLVIFS